MTPAKIKAAGKQLPETVMDQGDVAALDQFLAPTFVDHSPYPGAPPTREGMKGSIRQSARRSRTFTTRSTPRSSRASGSGTASPVTAR